jgi:hypothetical protein
VSRAEHIPRPDNSGGEAERQQSRAHLPTARRCRPASRARDAPRSHTRGAQRLPGMRPRRKPESTADRRAGIPRPWKATDAAFRRGARSCRPLSRLARMSTRRAHRRPPLSRRRNSADRP